MAASVPEEGEATERVASVPVADLVAELKTDATEGLDAAEAARRLADSGPNESAPIQPPTWPRVFARQFASKLIWILVLATVTSLLLQEWLNAGAIGVTVLASAGFGFLNEWRSEKAIAALAQLTARRAEVRRDGQHVDIVAREVVPGDILVVDDGDVVAADGRVIESRGLLVNESILSGEPEAVAKSPVLSGEESATASTIVFAGTTVASGSGTVLVTATGPATRLGSIYRSMQSAERQQTPLEQRLEMLGNRLILIFLVVCALLIVVGLVQGRDPQLVVELAVSLAIGAVPEGLPAVATAALAIAVRRLARREVLVRRLDAVETLGSTTLIVTDKTGTLTENRMVVRSVLLAGGEEAPVALDERGAGNLQTTIQEHDEAAGDILSVAALCSDARVAFDKENGWQTFGDPSEVAILRAAMGLGERWARLESETQRTATVAFSSETRMMTTTHAGAGGTFTAAKGAFEPIARWTGEEHERLRAEVHALGDLGYRVFAVARETDGHRQMLGAVVLEDPIRADAADAVAACHAAGIGLILVTGDQVSTATTIARQAGILADGQRAILASALDLDHVDDVAVVARANHQQKESIVRALQARGEVVAMTGDGVNDAAALRSSHVGVAVGPAATDVAVEAADIFLSRGHLLSLVEGITEGRQVTASLRQAMIYLLTASFAMIVLIGGGLLLSETPALGSLQILWLNLVVHIFPALALAVSRDAGSAAARPTRELFTRETWLEIAIRAGVAGAAGLGVVLVAEAADLTEVRLQTAVYLTMGTALVGQCFLIGVRSPIAQGPRLRRTELWAAAGMSVALLLGGAYLPALSDALNLDAPRLRDLGLAGAAVFLAWNVSQVTAALAVRVPDSEEPPPGAAAECPPSP